MFLKIVLLAWTLVFKETISSVVIDSLSQKGIVVSEYCPNMPYCEEGAHVMCMYYDPTRVMGPRCHQPRNVSMTSELAIKLLEVSNAIRGKLAMGVEKGKNGVELPRAYGMFKLHWDNELATFAQVLANQCVLRHDMCRATKKFPDPGQTAGLIRFSSPDWIPVSKSKGNHFAQPGLSPTKITYAVTQALKTWYAQKSFVTPAMIIDYPDWNLIPTKQNGRPYLEMVSAPATHMGCGISAYAEYAYYEAKSPLNYNSMQVICNFSTRPMKHKSVFDLEPRPHTSRCGCPINAIEDESCLCIYIEEKDEPKPELDCDGINCEQPVILLPIFTVEDAPPSKLLGRRGAAGDKVLRQRNHRPNFMGTTNSLEFTDEDFPTNHSKSERVIVKVMSGIGDDNNFHQSSHNQMRMTANRYMKSHVPNSRHGQQRKTSIFSRTVLINPKESNHLKLSLKDFKKDVIPRKDFSEAKHLLNNYVESIKNYTDLSYRPRLTQIKGGKSRSYSNVKGHLDDAQEILIVDHDDKNIVHPTHIENRHNEMGHIEMDHNEIGNNEIRHNEIGHTGILHDALGHDENIHTKILHDTGQEEISHNEIQYSDIHEGDRDSKLMSLLDKLEEEVQHIELKGNKKELFDAKIRKIYGSVVGKSSGLTIPTNKLNIPSLDDIQNGALKKLDINNVIHHENEHDSFPELVQSHGHKREDHEHDNMYKNELEKHQNNKFDKTEIGKTIDDIINSNQNNNADLRNNLDEFSDIVPNGRMRIKARIRDGNSEYDFGENQKKSSRKDKLLSIYRNSDSVVYKSHRYPEYRKYYRSKNQGPSNEDYKLSRSTVDDRRSSKILKHRDYYKNRDGNSIETLGKTHYRRHQTRNEDWNIDDDVLSPERRKYYQERLENLERQLQNTRSRKYRIEDDRHRRTMRVQGFVDEAPRRPSKNRMDHFDMRERSRFLHGY